MKSGYTQVKYVNGSSGIGLTLYKPYISTELLSVVDGKINETWVASNVFAIDALRDLIVANRHNKYIKKGFYYDIFVMGDHIVRIFNNKKSAKKYFNRHNAFGKLYKKI